MTNWAKGGSGLDNRKIPIEEVMLERFDFVIKGMVDKALIPLVRISPKVYLDPILEHMIVELRASIASEQLARIDVKYPKDWWQALKERWFPEVAIAPLPGSISRGALRGSRLLSQNLLARGEPLCAGRQMARPALREAG